MGDKISWIIFVFALVLALITLTSVVFPALIMGSGDHKFDVDLFELGLLSYPFLIIDGIVFGLIILYLTNKFPKSILSLIRNIRSFEVSKEVAIIVFIVLLGIYITFSINELLEPDPWEDYERVVRPALENWDISKFTELTSPNLVYLLGKISFKLFGNYRVIAFIASIALVSLTYLLTKKISGKRVSGLVAMVVLLQSNNFLTYDTTITYTNFWILFFVLSLYLIYKKWPISPLSFLLSIPSKAITIAYFPVIFIFAYRAPIPNNKKILVIVSFTALILIGSVIVVTGAKVTQTNAFDSHSFWSGFTAFNAEFRFDYLITFFTIPLIVGLYLVSRSGIIEADSIIFVLGWILLLAALLPALTQFDNNPYRFVMYSVFFAIGIGVLFSKIKQAV